MKRKDKYRVLLMCKACDKVYNGTVPGTYERAMIVYHNTILHNTDICKNKECDEPLVPILQSLPNK